MIQITSYSRAQNYKHLISNPRSYLEVVNVSPAVDTCNVGFDLQVGAADITKTRRGCIVPDQVVSNFQREVVVVRALMRLDKSVFH